jgi:ankyrin repeat protein
MNKLHSAAEEGDVRAILKVISELGIDINCPAKDKSTPLHLATKSESQECVRFLLQQGAGPNYRNNKGMTPLHIAAGNGNEAIMLLLLESSADPDSKDNHVC